MKELVAVRQSVIGAGQVNTVNARDLHLFLGVGKDFSNWIKKQIERARLVENRDYCSFTQKGEREIGATMRTEYHLTLEAGKHIAMLSGTEKGFEVREYFIECEKVANQPQNNFQLPTTYAGALRALADETERREHAEKTKAQIGAKREATAMNTASQLAKKNQKLEGLLDHLKEYSSIKRMEMIFHGQKFNWRELKAVSLIMKLPPIDVFDQNYGSVKAYHRSVWKALYAIDAEGNYCQISDDVNVPEFAN